MINKVLERVSLTLPCCNKLCAASAVLPSTGLKSLSREMMED